MEEVVVSSALIVLLMSHRPALLNFGVVAVTLLSQLDRAETLHDQVHVKAEKDEKGEEEKGGQKIGQDDPQIRFEKVVDVDLGTS